MLHEKQQIPMSLEWPDRGSNSWLTTHTLTITPPIRLMMI